MGVGPMIAWRRASRDNLRKNLLLPGIVGVWVFLLMIVLAPSAFGRAVAGIGRAIAALNVAGVLDHVKAFYPAITFGIGGFVLATMALEYYRGVRVRVHRFSESVPTAFAQLIWRNRRRYAGYIVHIGMVLIFFGIAGSSAYRKETVQVLEPGQYLQVDDYTMRYDGFDLEAVDDHLAAVTHVTLFDRQGGKPLASLRAEQRAHLNNLVPELREAFRMARELGRRESPQYQEAVARVYDMIPALEQRYRREVKTPSTEVGIHASWSPLHGSRLGEDFYVIPMWVDPATGRANFRIFVNPMVNFIWFGGLVFVLGSIVTILPDSRERKRLEAALVIEDRAVA